LANIVTVGMGYVGLTTALGFAKLGHNVFGVEIDRERFAVISSGQIPIFEPELESELKEALSSGRLTLTDSIEAASQTRCVYFVCVPTPQDDNGSADLTYVLSAVKEISDFAQEKSLIVIKSTVPVGSGELLQSSIKRNNLLFASNPEFLREGSALHDFMNPDRIVVGAENNSTAQLVLDLYANIDTQKITTTVKSAELIKYAANAYLASRLSFVNDIAALCEVVGANVEDVVLGMGSDSRIGKSFLKPGPGWGGSCFPKDSRALLSVGRKHGLALDVVAASITSNQAAFVRVATRLKFLLGGELNGKKIAIWGLSFKAGTDDTRDSPSLEIIKELLRHGCEVKAFDPVASAPEWVGLSQAESATSATVGADALLVVTEWSEFGNVDPLSVSKQMRGSVVLDTRRVLPAKDWRLQFQHFHVLGEGS
jgi:UDPglucose 6-dehydrogenase